jgi:hypothetical protein
MLRWRDPEAHVETGYKSLLCVTAVLPIRLLRPAAPTYERTNGFACVRCLAHTIQETRTTAGGVAAQLRKLSDDADRYHHRC